MDNNGDGGTLAIMALVQWVMGHSGVLEIGLGITRAAAVAGALMLVMITCRQETRRLTEKARNRFSGSKVITAGGWFLRTTTLL